MVVDNENMMTLQKITDDNYWDLIKNAPRSILVISTTWCPTCRTYKPTISSVSNMMPYINFGEAILDQGKLIQLKREYPDIASWRLPMTILKKNGNDVMKFNGAPAYNQLYSNIKNSLIIGSTVYLPRSQNKFVPAEITHIRETQGISSAAIYVLKLLEDSEIGKKYGTIEVPVDKFSWKI